MAVARQSEPDQSVNADAAAARELSRAVAIRECRGHPGTPWALENIDFAVQSLA
jgi:hypothetical protein